MKNGFTGWGSCQNEAAWFLRTRENVVAAFAKIWGVEQSELISSLDIFICYRQWWLNSEEDWKPKPLPLHVD